jgi:hypothetical protein
MANTPFRFVDIGPWPAGMNTFVPDTELSLNMLRDAVNVDLKISGVPETRPNWEKVFDGTCHSLFEYDGRAFGVVDDVVGELSELGFQGSFAVDGPVDWTVLNDAPVFVTPQGVFTLSGARFTAQSDEQDVDESLIDLPGGHLIEYWNGRLVVARGSAILFSEPLRYGAHNPFKGYILLESRPQWMAALEGGVYVGLKNRVVFLSGRTPYDFEVKTVAARSAPGMAVVVSSSLLGDDRVQSPRVVVFFTEKGFTIGTPDGMVIYPQKGVVSDLPLFRGKLIVDHNRIFAVRGF